MRCTLIHDLQVVALCFVLLAWSSDALASPQNSAEERPNIVFILADDLGYGELGCYGQKTILTPRLDQMAGEGMRFLQFYSGATVCAPSRSVLMTGLHHGHTRVRGNAGAANPGAQALRHSDRTVASVLQQAGYRTALIGKWGLGDVGAAETGLPRRQGFDEFFGFLNQQHAHNHFPSFLWKDEEKVTLKNDLVPAGETGAGYSTNQAEFADDLFAAEALRFVRNNRDQPFFLYWSLVTPHANNERTRSLGNGASVPDFGPYADRDWPEQDKGHAAMISRLDGHVGRLLDELRDLKIDRKTLVIFTSDNGPHNESRHDLKRFQPSGPFSGIKRSLTDGGIRVPMIAWWPGQIFAGSTSPHVSYFGDLMATASELAGVSTPDGLDSLSLVPVFKRDTNNVKTHEFLYWEFHEGGFRQAALYQGRWKGIRGGGPDAPVRLYDLQSDPAEQTDVASKESDIAALVSDYLKNARSDSPDWKPIWKEGRGDGGKR